MHSEPFTVNLDLLKAIIELPDGAKIIAVGTTSTRTLESLYFLARQCYLASSLEWVPEPIKQWEAYEDVENPPLKTVLNSLISYMEAKHMDSISTKTQIIIVPGYKFKVVDVLITNFHQPKSTLLLLISAFIGEDWRRVYDYALKNKFRFLSYGDSSILIR